MNYRVVVKRLAKSDLDVALEYYAIIRENLKDSLLEEVSKVFLLLEKNLIAPETPCGSKSHHGMMLRFHALTTTSTS